MIDGSRGRTRGVVDVAASWERFRNLNGEESESEVNVEFDRSSEDLDVDDRDAGPSHGAGDGSINRSKGQTDPFFSR